MLARRQKRERGRQDVGARGDQSRGHRTPRKIVAYVGAVGPEHEDPPVVPVVRRDRRLRSMSSWNSGTRERSRATPTPRRECPPRRT